MDDLLALAVGLGARAVAGWSAEEAARVAHLAPPPQPLLDAVRLAIAAGEDPLGAAFCALRSPVDRRPMGATYTPPPLVDAMVRAATRRDPAPVRVVDPGAGSGRFLVAAGRALPHADLVGVELDPAAAVLARGHLAAAGLAARASVRVIDFRQLHLSVTDGPTLFVGNPPYVRHHDISARWKGWLGEQAQSLGLKASKLAGLHVHFFLATALLARPGDFGVYVTSSEWLDVNYGRLVRALLCGPLGLTGLHLVEPDALPFEDALTTAVVCAFEVGSQAPMVGFERVADLQQLDLQQTARWVARDDLAQAPRWTPLSRPPRVRPAGLVDLGSYCQVHRGQVTGANKVWIAGPEAMALPASLRFPCVTRARELFAAGDALVDASTLREVVDLPIDLDTLPDADRAAVDGFLAWARARGAPDGYIARHRRAWWAVGLKAPAPILATYMARRPPGFVRNRVDARHINIAHGLYPREALSPLALDALADFLRQTTQMGQGRTYAGGLTKFEPKEMERLWVPRPDSLEDGRYRTYLQA